MFIQKLLPLHSDQEWAPVPLPTPQQPLGKDLLFSPPPPLTGSCRRDGEERGGMEVENLLLSDIVIRCLHSLGLQDIQN